ncbi:cytochrome c oxidase cbb3-type, subunit IV [Thioploca ingrica]|uniref:Cytochrome c oxidase cbb3-type, subunit IV n=1 Tax=Thioploca ingrica TaxID=40754 RepID=A0A090AFR6_9GAMM|nr:cytochrome c oxidase cbb3-type, subunit IV [Thioploca ingrica]
MGILPLIHSIWTIVVMVVFLSIVVWAYSSKRQVKFDEAARLPLDDDDSVETIAKEKRHV